MSSADIDAIVQAVLAELRRDGRLPADGAGSASAPAPAAGGEVVIDLPDPAEPELRRRIGVPDPVDAEGLANLCSTTTARIGVGRAGPRPRTSALLLFQGDHGVAQDAIYGTVDEEVKAQFDLFTVETRTADQDEYLLRPDLGRRLTDEAKATIAERCKPNPQVQIVVGAGLSAAAVNHQLPDILPVIQQGLATAGLSVGTPFYIERARVGVMNDVGEATGAETVLLLIGERPGLGVADALSAYMGYQPRPGKTDADRDLICMITYAGGTNPLEAGAYVVEKLQEMLREKASGVALGREDG